MLGFPGSFWISLIIMYCPVVRCQDPDDPCSDPDICLNGGTCIDRSGGRYRCACPAGYEAKHCGKKIRACISNPCLHGGTCVEVNPTGYKCKCHSSLTGLRCETDITDSCVTGQCENGGTCVDDFLGFYCECTPEWDGPRCELVPPEPCLSNPCGSYGTCTNLENKAGFTCACSAGFVGSLCNINTCTTNDFECLNGGTCRPSPIGCNCFSDYLGPQCQFENPCVFGPRCQNSLKCIPQYISDNVPPYRVCICQDDYGGDVCDRYLGDKCNEEGGNRCQNGGTCEDINGVVTCECPKGYLGSLCSEDRDECASVEPACLNGGRCINTDGSFECDCSNVMFTGPLCEERVGLCASGPCENDGTCAELPTPPYDIYCVCLPGWTGKLCDQNIDECGSSPCIHGTCLDHLNLFLCNCTTGWTGTLCEMDTICTAPVDLQPCDVNGTESEGCYRRAAPYDHDFGCRCLSGYTGKTCSVAVDECESAPCQNEGTCVDGNSSFTCICNNDTTGEFCELAHVVQKQVLCDTLYTLVALQPGCQDWFIISGVVGLLMVTIMGAGVVVSLCKSASEAEAFRKTMDDSDVGYEDGHFYEEIDSFVSVLQQRPASQSTLNKSVNTPRRPRKPVRRKGRPPDRPPTPAQSGVAMRPRLTQARPPGPRHPKRHSLGSPAAAGAPAARWVRPGVAPRQIGRLPIPRPSPSTTNRPLPRPVYSPAAPRDSRSGNLPAAPRDSRNLPAVPRDSRSGNLPAVPRDSRNLLAAPRDSRTANSLPGPGNFRPTSGSTGPRDARAVNSPSGLQDSKRLGLPNLKKYSSQDPRWNSSGTITGARPGITRRASSHPHLTFHTPVNPSPSPPPHAAGSQSLSVAGPSQPQHSISSPIRVPVPKTPSSKTPVKANRLFTI